MRRDTLNVFKVGIILGLECILPAMGYFPLDDSQGMSIAVIMLHRSLDKGRY